MTASIRSIWKMPIVTRGKRLQHRPSCSSTAITGPPRAARSPPSTLLRSWKRKVRQQVTQHIINSCRRLPTSYPTLCTPDPVPSQRIHRISLLSFRLSSVQDQSQASGEHERHSSRRATNDPSNRAGSGRNAWTSFTPLSRKSSSTI